MGHQFDIRYWGNFKPGHGAAPDAAGNGGGVPESRADRLIRARRQLTKARLASLSLQALPPSVQSMFTPPSLAELAAAGSASELAACRGILVAVVCISHH